MGMSHAALGKPEAALDAASRAIALSPRDPSSWVAYGVRATASFQLGDMEQAVHWGRQALTEHAGNVPVALPLTAALAAGGELPAARELRRSVHELDPTLRIALLEDRFPVARWRNLQALKAGLARAGLPA